MHKYVIYDVWMSLRLSLKNFFYITMILVIISLIFFSFVKGIPDYFIEKYIYWMIIIILLVFIQSMFIYFANRRYIIDLNTNLITFPRSDIENSIFAIIFLYPYWNLMRTITINVKDIENMYLDTKKWSTKHKINTGISADGKNKYKTETKNYVRYTLNIVGTFGSANLEFLSRQKRDEVRNAIQQSVNKCSNKNVDKKVAEFD